MCAQYGIHSLVNLYCDAGEIMLQGCIHPLLDHLLQPPPKVRQFNATVPRPQVGRLDSQYYEGNR